MTPYYASLNNAQPLVDGAFAPPILFIGPEHAMATTGSFGKLTSAYRRARTANKRAPSIQVWTDFDLYHRNDHRCADLYAAKLAGVPDFLFSFHNFEDFFALHHDGHSLAEWIRFGGPAGRNHFAQPLHSDGYRPEIERMFPGYTKGRLPPDFISWESLRNLKANLRHQPSGSNPCNLAGIRSFAEFLIREIEAADPGALAPAPVVPGEQTA